jgi:hypothetical protein
MTSGLTKQTLTVMLCVAAVGVMLFSFAHSATAATVTYECGIAEGVAGILCCDSPEYNETLAKLQQIYGADAELNCIRPTSPDTSNSNYFEDPLSCYLQSQGYDLGLTTCADGNAQCFGPSSGPAGSPAEPGAMPNAGDTSLNCGKGYCLLPQRNGVSYPACPKVDYSICASQDAMNVNFGQGTPLDRSVSCQARATAAGYSFERVPIQFVGLNVSVNAKVVDAFKAVEKDIQSVATSFSGTQYFFPSGGGQVFEFLSSGTWNPRPIRGYEGVDGKPCFISNHAWATAIDLNAGANGLAYFGALCGTNTSLNFTMPPEVVWAFEKNGFRWGGRYTRFDPMHFEYCQAPSASPPPTQYSEPIACPVYEDEDETEPQRGKLTCDFDVTSAQSVDWAGTSATLSAYLKVYNTDDIPSRTWIGHPELQESQAYVDAMVAKLGSVEAYAEERQERIRVTQALIDQAAKYGFSERFIITLWMEETAASAVGLRNLGCISFYGDRDTTLIPYGLTADEMITRLREQVDCINSYITRFPTLKLFMCNYSGGVDSRPGNTCFTNGEFKNNPNFPKNICTFYNLLG